MPQVEAFGQDRGEPRGDHFVLGQLEIIGEMAEFDLSVLGVVDDIGGSWFAVTGLTDAPWIDQKKPLAAQSVNLSLDYFLDCSRF